MNNWMDELVSISYMVLEGGKRCVTLQTMMPLPLWFFEPTWSENVSIYWPLRPYIGCAFEGSEGSHESEGLNGVNR